MLLIIAWRNLWRNKKRSLVILSAIAAGLCGGLFATGLMVGLAESMVDTAIDRYLGHLELHTATYRSHPVIQDTIPDADRIGATLRSMSGVTGVTARTVVDGIASSPRSFSGVKIVGVVPGDEKAVTTTWTKIREGGFLDADGRLAVVVGRKLAEKLQVRYRSKLVLGFAGRDGTILYGSFRIAGVFETESSLFDRTTVFVRRDDLARLLGGAPSVQEIAVRLASAASVPDVLTRVREMEPTLAVDGWKDLAPELKLTAEMTDISMLFFLAIILFGLLFGITNTMLMSVLDRVREFGVLMAIGMKRKRVFALVLLETLLLSVTGGLIGAAAGAATVAATRRHGIDLSVFADGLSSYGITSIVIPVVPASVYVGLSIMVVLTALGAAVYPGVKATKLQPAASIRSYA